MAFVNDFLDMMSDTLRWRPLAGRDDYGAPDYGSTDGDEFECRLVRENKLVRTVQGDEVVSTAHVWIGGTPMVRPEDQIELSDGTTPEILSVEIFQDEDGGELLSHTKVYFR